MGSNSCLRVQRGPLVFQPDQTPGQTSSKIPFPHALRRNQATSITHKCPNSDVNNLPECRSDLEVNPSFEVELSLNIDGHKIFSTGARGDFAES